MSGDEKEPEYAVGYAKPPQHSRFKPGQSGNLKGKPRGSKNFTTIVSNALTEKVTVTEHGKRRRVSKIGVVIKQLINKAATGDAKATVQVVALAQMIESRAENATTTTALATSHADQLTMEGITGRILRNLHPKVDPELPEGATPPEKDTRS